MFHQTYNTKRLIIKKVDKFNIEKYFNDIVCLYTDEDIMKYSGFGTLTNKDEVEQLFFRFLQKENFYLWLLIEKNEDKYIGDVSLFIDTAHLYGSVGCFLNKTYQHKGYMTEALKEILFSFFIEFGFHRAEAQVHRHNESSIKFFEHFGFQYEGILRENFLLNGTFYDSRMYSMLFDEFINRYAQK
ncbi:MAG: GNAT family N-acetyltransferase [Bacteroidales bacterium]|nr:GNAT family N-acetyltransferase [Bacteroidales bacterium]